MAFNKGDKTDASKIRRGGMRRRKKVCVFCGEKNGEIDYKDTYPREEKFFRDVSLATVLNIREL